MARKPISDRMSKVDRAVADPAHAGTPAASLQAGADEADSSCFWADGRISRRRFLMLSGASLVAVTLSQLGPVPALARIRTYPREKVGQISRLFINRPREFFYPFQHPHMRNFLIKLGVPAGGGVGRLRDVVAFNGLCPHRGGPLAGRYNARHKVFGPCPFHLSTFDLTRHGMVVSGHATQGLPQILLEVDGDDIYAVGVMGLVYGFGNNLARPSP